MKQDGNGPSRHPVQISKKQSVLIMRRHSIVKIFIKFTAPKNNRRDTHKTRKTASSPTGNIKSKFFIFFSRKFLQIFFREKVSVPKKEFSLAKRFSQEETIYETQEGTL